jgi:glycosyltransferase involved in cell wall biosynthesis
MIIHLVALPHTQVSKDFSACAFNEKVRKFAIMMKDLGHTVYIYAGEHTKDTKSDENIVCITEKERVACLNGKHYTEASFDYSLPHWRKFNGKVIEGIRKRIGKKDLICIIGGLAHKEVADAFPDNMTVEFGIGYGGSFAKYRVFESYAWMHTTYGAQNGNPNAIDGNWYDDVIPNYFDLEDFPLQIEKEDYYLYIGRLTERKGWAIAQQVCEKLGKRLIVAGPGEFSSYGEYVGVVGPEKRAQLMGGAIATFVPTIYIEPFGGVAIESMLCGTPIITTDWGAFVETNIDGVTGFRCRTFQQFLDATEDVKKLDSTLIRGLSEKYSLENIGLRYEEYFQRLLTLYKDGWYTINRRK